MQFFWFLPRHGDCRYLGTSHRARTVTLDRFSNGRLINTVSGGDPNEQHGDGSFLTHAERHEVTHEFLKIWRGVAAGEAVNFSGEHLKVENAKTLYPPVQKPCPPLWFSGSSDEAIELAGEQVDVYLTWGDPAAAVADKIAKARASAARHGRTLRLQNVRPAGQANLTGPFGEVIANDIVPPASKAPRQGAPA